MRTVAAVVIEKMAPLDLWGPIQAFQVAFATNPDEPVRPDSSKPLYKVITLGKAKGPVATGSGSGPAVMVDHSFSDDVDYDILLIPGGQVLFFEANFWNPQVFLKNFIRPIGRWSGQARCQVGMRKYKLMKIASHQGFTNIEVIPYDIVHPRFPRFFQKAWRRTTCRSRTTRRLPVLSRASA